jgi:predicted anti-sigma-YlaC factor YlaD
MLINQSLYGAKRLITGLFLFSLLSACSVQNLLLRNAGDILSKETSASDEDLELLMHASAYHLKLSESLLQEIPNHAKLAESVARGYTQYAFVFLMDEADRIESDSLQKANQLRTRAAKILMRAQSNGLKTLNLLYPQLGTYLNNPAQRPAFKIKPEDTGLVYWTMTAWAGGISLSKDSPDVVADLPQVLRLAELAWQASPQYDQGALASMMGTLELAKPGGQNGTAEKYFDMAIAWRESQIAPLISKAENWAVATQNRSAFEQLLKQAIDLGHNKSDLINTVMTRRARWLLDNADNLF